MLAGLVVAVAGAVRLGGVLRFVSNTIMVGFINAVGVEGVLGQLADFAGYEAPGEGRLARTLELLLTLGQVDLGSTAVGDEPENHQKGNSSGQTQPLDKHSKNLTDRCQIVRADQKRDLQCQPCRSHPPLHPASSAISGMTPFTIFPAITAMRSRVTLPPEVRQR